MCHFCNSFPCKYTSFICKLGILCLSAVFLCYRCLCIFELFLIHQMMEKRVVSFCTIDVLQVDVLHTLLHIWLVCKCLSTVWVESSRVGCPASCFSMISVWTSAVWSVCLCAPELNVFMSNSVMWVSLINNKELALWSLLHYYQR